MKKFLILIVLSCTLSSSCFAQKLITRAIFYEVKKSFNSDKTYDMPFKLEQKFFDDKDSSTIFLSHGWDNSLCIKVKKYQEKDTLIVSEEYMSYPDAPKTHFGEIYEDRFGVFGNGKIKDSIRVSISATSGGYADTTFCLKNIDKKLREHIDEENAYEYALLSNKLALDFKIDFNKLILNETVQSYYINNHLIKMVWIKGKGEKYYQCNCESGGKKLKYRCFALYNPDSYEGGATLGLNQLGKPKADSIEWNMDYASQNFIDTNKTKTSTVNWEYYLTKSGFVVVDSGVYYKEIKYKEAKDVLKSIINDVIDNDKMYSIFLKRFDELKIDEKKYAKSAIKKYDYLKNEKYQYSYDKQMRIKDVKILLDNEIDSKIVFEYPQ